MKGFMIYETPLWGDEENIVYLQEVKDASYTLKQVGSDDITCYLEGSVTKEPVTKAICNKDDTYDFEMGALIALMKKCGLKKVAEACNETFPRETAGSMYRENKRYVKRIKELEEKVDNLYAYNKSLIDDIDQKNHEIISLKALKLANESLKKDNESFRKTIDKLKGEIERLDEEKKHLEDKYERCQHILDARIKDKHRLEEENEKLKLDCEKLQHGYNDFDMIFCGGRQNGKQHKALVALFKKIPQDNIDAAYREAYNTTLPVWQKEFIKQLYDICKENKPLTKREQMWEKIFELHKESDVIFEVKREDVTTFLHELENKFPEITWASSIKIFETKYTIKNVYFELKTHDTIYFRLSKETKLSYSSDHDIYQYRELKHVEYLPPMRWDLFKRGRIAVGVRKEQYNEFKEEINRQFGIINLHKPYDDFNYSFFIFDKNANFVEAIGRSQFRQLKTINGHKVYYWEDVR